MNTGINRINIGGAPAFKGNTGATPEQLKQLEQFKQFQCLSQEKPKTGAVQGTKDFIAGMKKAWINVAEYTSSTVGGVVNSVLYGGAALGVARLANEFKKPQAERAVMKTVFAGIAAGAEKLKGAVVYLVELPKTKFKTVAKDILAAPLKLTKALVNAPGVGNLGKAAAAAVGLGALGVSLFRASLNVSERTANVDHRFNTGHRAE